MEVGEVLAVEQGWSLPYDHLHFSRKGESRLVVVEYVGVVGGDVGRHHWGSEERQMECDVGCVGKLVGSGIEEASSEARLNHDGMDQIRHRHHHHRPIFPSH
jgi:hypothetical protein